MTSRTSAPDRLAQAGHGVDEAELGGQEGVGGVLDRLGRRRVGDQQRGMGAGEQLAHPGRRGLVVRTDHDALGMQAVGHRRALAEELRVRHHRDVVASEHPLDHQGRADRHRRLVHDDRSRAARWGAISAGHRLDEGEVGRAVVALRRGNAEEDELGVLHGGGGPGHERADGRPPGPLAPAPRGAPRRWGRAPRCSMATLAGSASPQVTRWPEVGERGRGGQARRSPRR